MHISARLKIGEMEPFHSVFSEHWLNKPSGFLTDEKSLQPVALDRILFLCLRCLTAVDIFYVDCRNPQILSCN